MDSVLMPNEIEFFVDTMRPQSLSSIGSKTWLEWHQRLQKLNQEAVVEASNIQDEHVKETLVVYGKVPVLVHEAILINIWRYKILPHILRLEPNPPNIFIAYSVLYHEAVCVALLELVMYHANCAESLSDQAIDLLDYACGLAAQLLVTERQEESSLGESEQQEFKRQQNNLVFDLGIRALSIIRYLAEYLDGLPLSVTTLMFNTHDVPVLLIQILLNRPWFKDGKLYSGGRWLMQNDEALGQPEAQVWLALHQLLTHPSCATHYSLTETRRSQLMKLLPLMSPILLDQLSPLIELKQWLCRVSVSDSSTTPAKPLLLEPVMEIKQSIIKEADGRWKKIAMRQVSVIFNTDPKELMDAAKSLSEAYNTDLLEKFEVKDKHTCQQCAKDAIQRCSRCKKEWYCSRSCQVAHWPQHKDICNETTDK